MMDHQTTGSIVKISALDIIKIRIFALLWGFWSILKFSIKRFLNSSVKENTVIGNPPSCITDTSLGQHSYVKIKGVKFHYVEAGIRGQPLVVLLHGFPDFWISWRNQIPELSNHFRVVAVDLKGFGDSDKPEGRSNYGITRIAEEITELVSSLGYKKFTLIGHDLGGLVGWFIVHLYPEMVQKFISISAPHPNLYWNNFVNRNTFNAKWLQFSQLPFLPEMEALQNDLTVIDNVYGHLNNTIDNKSFLNAYKYAFSRKEDWTGPINYFRTLPLWRLDAAEGSVDVPTLLIVGNQEPREFFECVIRSTDFIEKYTLKVIENASRYVHQEKPKEVNKVLLNFLIGNLQPVSPTKPPTDGLVTRLFGAVTNYGNDVFDAVLKVNPLTLRGNSYRLTMLTDHKLFSNLSSARGNQPSVSPTKPASNGLVTRMFGAVSNTIGYGNGVFDVVKKANQTGLRALTSHGNSS